MCGGRGGRACGAGSGGQDSSSVGGGLCCHSGVASEECVKGVLLSKGELGGQDFCRRKLPAGPETPGRRAVGSPPRSSRARLYPPRLKPDWDEYKGPFWEQDERTKEKAGRVFSFWALSAWACGSTCQSWRAAADRRGHGVSGGLSLQTQTDVRGMHGPERPTARCGPGDPSLPLSAAGEPAEAILVQVHGALPSHWGLSTGPCAFRFVSLHLHV